MKKYAKRYLSLALSFALVFAIPFAFTQEASAASKKGVKVYQPVQITETYNDGSVDTTTYVYDKNGFCTGLYYSSGSKRLSTYNKTGLVTSWTRYYKDGTVSSQGKNTIKKGKIAKEEYYDMDEGKLVLSSVTSYKYKKGKKSTETVTFPNSASTDILTYRSNGTRKKAIYSTKTDYDVVTYDKKGNITSYVSKDLATGKIYKDQYKNTYKKGKLVKRVATYVDTDGKVSQGGTTTYSYKKGKLAKTVYTYTSTFDGGTYTDTTTTLYTFNKAGLLTRKVRTTVEVSPSKTTTSTKTTTIKYKKIKVPKKAKKNIKETMLEFTESFLPIQMR